MKNLLVFLGVYSIQGFSALPPVLEEVITFDLPIPYQTLVIGETIIEVKPTQKIIDEQIIISQVKFDFSETKLNFSDLHLMSEEVIKKLTSLVKLNECNIEEELEFISKSIVGKVSCKGSMKFSGNLVQDQDFNLQAYNINVIRGSNEEVFTYSF